MDESRRLARVLELFLAADGLDRSEQVVMEHPELLSDEADLRLEHLIESAQEDGRIEAADAIARYRQLLQRSREIGVAPAFAEQSQVLARQAVLVRVLQAVR